MAAGDEKLDLFDQTFLRNRLTDGVVDIMLDGKPVIWKAGETKPIPRCYAGHFLKHSTYLWDPTEQNLPKRKLVEVDATGKVVGNEDGSPLTLDDASPLDLIDDSNLPPRFFDTETGQPMTRKEGRITGIDARRERGSRTLVKGQAEWNRPEGREGLEQAAEAAAAAES